MSLRREREVEYITGAAAIEKHSIFARPEHAGLLAAYLRSKGATVQHETDVVGGEDNLLVDKSIDFHQVMNHVNEWKKTYAEGTD